MVQKSLALLGLLLFSTYSVAAPVDCEAIECIVSDGGASITTEGGIEKDLVDVFLNGIISLNPGLLRTASGSDDAFYTAKEGAVKIAEVVSSAGLSGMYHVFGEEVGSTAA
jgi:hypothetical protein